MSSTRRLGVLGVVLTILGLLLGWSQIASAHQPTAHPSGAPKPTVVLVHGAFADASGWSGVMHRLQSRGYTVYAPANPLRGLTSDAAYLRTFLHTITGPIVLVGHSYGGAVITNAATGNPHVTSLVYVAAFAPAQGETVSAASALDGGSNDLSSHLVLRAFGPGQLDQDGYIDPAFFRETFAQDLPRRQTDVMAYSQRPAAVATLVTPSGPPAWADIPSWYLVAHDDHTIPPVAERYMAKRAHAHTIEIRSSHVAMISHPGDVTRLILRAAR